MAIGASGSTSTPAARSLSSAPWVAVINSGDSHSWAATSVNEQTLTFVPKLAVTAFVLVLLGGSMMGLMTDFTQDIFAMIPEITR